MPRFGIDAEFLSPRSLFGLIFPQFPIRQCGGILDFLKLKRVLKFGAIERFVAIGLCFFTKLEHRHHSVFDGIAGDGFDFGLRLLGIQGTAGMVWRSQPGKQLFIVGLLLLFGAYYQYYIYIHGKSLFLLFIPSASLFSQIAATVTPMKSIAS